MTPKILMAALCLVLPSLVPSTPARAQADGTDPLTVAIHHIITADSVGGLGAQLVFDTRQSGLRGPTHAEHTQAQIARIATALGARPGSLQEIMSCPSRAPEPHEYLLVSCRFSERVGAVLQVSEPRTTNSGLSVVITKWTYTEGPTRRTTYVAAISREVLLQEDSHGGWRAAGIGLVSHARM